jgi:hypothetical protein
LDPQSGDCAELYFAGTNLDSESDIHDLVAQAPPQRRAFLQLQLPVAGLEERDLYLPDWRTDAALIRQALLSGFTVNIWKSEGGWNGEARIPLAAFDKSVHEMIVGGKPLRAAITYLDYDRENTEGWIFHPDNVFCPDPDERNVNVPRYMRQIVFER